MSRANLGRSLLDLPYAITRRDLVARHWRDHRLGVIAIAIFNPLFYILVLYALTFASVAYLGLTRELSVLITVLMASLVLGECDLRQRLFWAAVMLVGNAVGWSDPEG